MLRSLLALRLTLETQRRILICSAGQTNDAELWIRRRPLPSAESWLARWTATRFRWREMGARHCSMFY